MATMTKKPRPPGRTRVPSPPTSVISTIFAGHRPVHVGERRILGDKHFQGGRPNRPSVPDRMLGEQACNWSGLVTQAEIARCSFSRIDFSTSPNGRIDGAVDQQGSQAGSPRE